jgi:hypothetical protein
MPAKVFGKSEKEEMEKKEIIRHKTIYEEDLFLMRSRIEYRFLIYPSTTPAKRILRQTLRHPVILSIR